jgi:FkbM family methyltransferase
MNTYQPLKPSKSDLLIDIRQRCVHIEDKINILISPGNQSPFSEGYKGHQDQAFGGSTYAQHGDDLIALNIFHCLGIDKPSYLDIGAHHPFNISNTALLYKRGCRGINVEANPELIEAFKDLRCEDTNLNIGVSDSRGTLKFYMFDSKSGRNTFDLHTAESFLVSHPWCKIQKTIEIEVTTINDIIDRFAGGRCPDFLTIDVEGFDQRILKSMDFSRFRPKVICVETVEKAILSEAGYHPCFRTVGNVFYIDKSLVPMLRL